MSTFSTEMPDPLPVSWGTIFEYFDSLGAVVSIDRWNEDVWRDAPWRVTITLEHPDTQLKVCVKGLEAGSVLTEAYQKLRRLEVNGLPRELFGLAIAAPSRPKTYDGDPPMDQLDDEIPF